MGINRRRHYFVKRRLQIHYILVMLLFALLAAFISGYTVFLTGWTLFGEKLAQVYPQGRLQTLFIAINISLVRNILLVLPMLFFIAIWYSHKIAGPLYRIEETLKAVGKGQLGFRVTLRKGDELREMETTLNEMIEGLESVKKSDTEIIERFLMRVDSVLEELAHMQNLPQTTQEKMKGLQDARLSIQQLVQKS